MPRRWLRRYLPDLQSIRERGRIGFFGHLLEDPFLLHLNRRSVAGGVAVGLFVCMLPIPMQMVVAAGVAILVRVNLLISVALVWVSNPFTMPPMLYASYKLGAKIMGANIQRKPFELRVEWFWDNLAQIWQPLLLGSVIIGLLAAAVGYLLAHLAWRFYVYRHLQLRSKRYPHNGRHPKD